VNPSIYRGERFSNLILGICAIELLLLAQICR